jgi:hypothetical protein
MRPQDRIPSQIRSLLAGWRRERELRVLAVVLCLSLMPLGDAAQNSRRPFSVSEVVSLLKGGVIPVRMEGLARDYGIAFHLTPQIEADLRSVGATDALLQTFRQLAPPPPARPRPQPPATPPLRLTGSVSVAAPPGTQVYVDHSTIPAATVGPNGIVRVSGLSIGNHRFRLVRSGYHDWTISVNIQPRQTATYQFTPRAKVSVPPPSRPLIVAPKAESSLAVVSFHVIHLHQLLGTCSGTLIIGNGRIQYIASKKSHSFDVPVSSMRRYGTIVYGANFFLVLPSGKDYDFRGPLAAVWALQRARSATPAAVKSGPEGSSQ